MELKAQKRRHKKAIYKHKFSTAVGISSQVKTMNVFVESLAVHNITRNSVECKCTAAIAPDAVMKSRKFIPNWLVFFVAAEIRAFHKTYQAPQKL